MAGKRVANKLDARSVKAKKFKPGRYNDGLGLWLQVSHSDTRSYIFQFTSPTTGRVRQLGLGSTNIIDLGEARDKAREASKLVLQGIDPIDAKHEQRSQRRLEVAKRLTFKEAAEKYIEAHRSSWKGEVHASQWEATLQTYAFPIIGALSVQAVDKGLVLKILEPIWDKKPETAGRLRARIERILDWAKARDLRTGENPARWRGHLDKVLPAVRKVKSVKHHPAMPYSEIPAFMAELRQRDSISARALEYTILTAGRTSEVIGMPDPELDLSAKLWTIPAVRMKGGREHRVPLCDRAVEIIKTVPREKNNPHIFAGGKTGRPLSNMALLELLKDMRPGLTVHGFRSTFRDWGSELTSYPNTVLEMALAHAVSDKVEAAYRRGDLFEKRRRLMADWAKFCATPRAAKQTDNVTPLKARAS